MYDFLVKYAEMALTTRVAILTNLKIMPVCKLKCNIRVITVLCNSTNATDAMRAL